MKQNKLLIVGMLVLPILLSACGGVQPAKIDLETKSQSWVTKEIKLPINVAKEVIYSSFEDRKKDTADEIYLMSFSAILNGVYSMDKAGIEKFEDKEWCISELYKKVCLDDKYCPLETSKNNAVFLTTGSCQADWTYRTIVKDGRPYFILAATVRDKNRANFDGSKFSSATLEEILQAKEKKASVSDEKKENWLYVEYMSVN